MKPRLWYQWEACFYQSGTAIVAQRLMTYEKPWLYIYADHNPNSDGEDTDKNRIAMCNELKRFMNGGERPKWLDDFERVSEVKLVALAGASITATGPMIDRDPPNLFWVQDKSIEAAHDRARLIDCLCGVGNG